MVNNIGDDENKMVSYKVVLWLLAVLLMLGWGTKVYADAMQAQDTLGDDGTLFLYAGAAVLIDADTGQVLYGKNEHSRMEPASLTKIITCLLAIEHSDPQEPVTATAESLNLPLDASVLGLYEGETMTMEQMLYAMMLPSANDAANAVGVHIAGSLSAFAQMMNEKAQELGLQDSTFYNSNGLPEEGHLSSAYDLAQITRAAMAYPEFLDYAGAEGYSIPEGEQNAAHAFLHTDRFLRQDTVYYDETAIAGKTGWTSTAGNCLMTVMQRDGRTLIAVVLQSDSDEVARAAYVDSQTLFDYGFDQFVQTEWTLPAQSEQYSDQSGSTVTLQSGEVSFQCLLPAGAQSSGAYLQFPQEPSEDSTAQVWLRLEDGSLWPWMLGEIPLTVSVVEEEPAMTQPQDEQQAGNGLNSGLIILAAVALGAVRLVVKQLNEKDHF